MNKDNLDKIISEKEKLIIVFFSEWCISSKKIIDFNKSMNHENVIYINTDEKKDIIDNFDIKIVPTIIYIKNKKITDICEGCNVKKISLFFDTS